jgi:hypothetical protein
MRASSKRPAPRRRTDLRVACTGEVFENHDPHGAGNESYGCHHQNSFEHGPLLKVLPPTTPDESCSRKTGELRDVDCAEKDPMCCAPEQTRNGPGRGAGAVVAEVCQGRLARGVNGILARAFLDAN